MSQVVGWGIVGCGDVVDRKSGGAFARIPGCRLVSVMRRDAKAAQAFASRHGATHWCTDARECIAHPEVDAVYVATPPAHHLEYALAVAAAGKPCLVEKPAGRSLAEFRCMRDAFRAAGVPLFVSYYRPFLPRYRKVKEILDSGVLGAIVSIEYRMSQKPRSAGWALDVAASGGGHFYGLAGHMLDAFDDWFGPLEYTGSCASNAIPRHTAEDAVSLTFRTAGGALGSCLWSFAASHSADELIIDQTRGRIAMRGTDVDSPVRVTFTPSAKLERIDAPWPRRIVRWRKRMGLPIQDTYRFSPVEWPHQDMLAEFSSRIARAEDASDNADAALRTAEVVDRALASYYRGRHDAFWTRPATWQSRQAQASRRNQGPLPGEYRLADEQLRSFERDGYVGPFRCEAAWQRLFVPPGRKGLNRHLDDADVFEVCTHPSVIRRVAQVMGRSRFSLFKTRFVVKLPQSDAKVPWHQDVGDGNGGFTSGGRAVPTVTVWMGIDEIHPGTGGLEVIPGSHRRLIGSYNEQLESGLVESGALGDAELARAVPVVLRPGEFIIYHGWLLHGSGPNASDRRRAGLNMRFAPPGLECEGEFVYIPLETGEVKASDRVFMNDVWGGKPDDTVPLEARTVARPEPAELAGVARGGRPPG